MFYGDKSNTPGDPDQYLIHSGSSRSAINFGAASTSESINGKGINTPNSEE